MMIRDDDRDFVNRIRHKYGDTLMQKHNVIGVAIGPVRSRPGLADALGIIVLVNGKLSAAQQNHIPAELEGIPVEVRNISKPRAW